MIANTSLDADRSADTSQMQRSKSDAQALRRKVKAQRAMRSLAKGIVGSGDTKVHHLVDSQRDSFSSARSASKTPFRSGLGQHNASLSSAMIPQNLTDLS